MHWPQVVMIVLLTLNGVISLFNHGEEYEVNFFGWMFYAAIYITLLSFGGFWG